MPAWITMRVYMAIGMLNAWTTAYCLRAKRRLGGMDPLGAAVIMIEKGIVVASDLTPAQEVGMAFLERIGIVEHDPGTMTEPHWDRNCSRADLHEWARNEAARLRIDFENYEPTRVHDLLSLAGI